MIQITPEHWKQPGAIRYTHKRKSDNTLWNVSDVRDGMAKLWSVNAWGSFQKAAITEATLLSDYDAIDAPSMYEQMDAVKQ